MIRRAFAAVAASAVVLAGLTFGAVPVDAAETITTNPAVYDPAQDLEITINGFPTMVAGNGYIYWLQFQGMTGGAGNTGASTGTLGSQTDCTAQTGVSFTKVSGAGTALPNGQDVVGNTNACEWVSPTIFKFSYKGATGLDGTSVVKLTFPSTGAKIIGFTAPASSQYGVNFTAGSTISTFQLSYVCWGNCPVSSDNSPVSTPPQITLNIDANEGRCATESVRGLQGSWTTAPGADNCSKPGARFIGYNTERNGSGIAIAPGGNLNLTFDNTLYAIYETPRPAAAPTEVVAVAGRNKITVSWKAPADAGTYAITNYLAQATPSGRVCVTRSSDANMLSCTFDLGATNTKYSFKVQALNGAGWGPVSTESAAVSPYNFREVSGSRANVLLGLAGTNVETNGAAPGLAGLAVTPEYKVGGAANWTSVANAARVNADGKFSWSKRFPASANKKNVTVRFTYGGDAVSDTLVLSRGGQSGSLTAPRNIKIENVINRVIVTWDPPKFDGGEKITGYTMCANYRGSLCRNVSADGRGVFQDLLPGDYTITVAAKTATRTGPAAEAKGKVRPVQASVGIRSRIETEIEVLALGSGFPAGTSFRLEVAPWERGQRVTSALRWKEVRSFTGGDFNKRFIVELGESYEFKDFAVRLVTPNGSVFDVDRQYS